MAQKEAVKGKFNNGDRVRLKFSVADLYRAAYGGSEAIIKKQKLDNLGHHVMVYVEWDKTHWTYNGEEDMWAFEDHFDLVEELNVDKPEKNDKSLADALIQFLQDWQDGDGSDNAPNIADTSEVDTEYSEALKAAAEYAADCDGFMLIGIKRATHPMDESAYVLLPDAHSYAKSEKVRLALGIQVSQIAAALHQENAADLIQELD